MCPPRESLSKKTADGWFSGIGTPPSVTKKRLNLRCGIDEARTQGCQKTLQGRSHIPL